VNSPDAYYLRLSKDQLNRYLINLGLSGAERPNQIGKKFRTIKTKSLGGNENIKDPSFLGYHISDLPFCQSEA
jgi:hypothetical protein